MLEDDVMAFDKYVILMKLQLPGILYTQLHLALMASIWLADLWINACIYGLSKKGKSLKHSLKMVASLKFARTRKAIKLLLVLPTT